MSTIDNGFVLFLKTFPENVTCAPSSHHNWKVAFELVPDPSLLMNVLFEIMLGYVGDMLIPRAAEFPLKVLFTIVVPNVYPPYAEKIKEKKRIE